MKPSLKLFGPALFGAAVLTGCASVSNTQTLSPLVLLPGTGMIVVSIAFIIFALRRGGTWGYLGLGALAWVGTVAVKFVIAFTINPAVAGAISVPDELWAPGNLLLYVYEGSLTGLTEVLLTWLLLHYRRFVGVSWGKVIAFGVGFGAVEALLLGGASLAAMLAGLLSPQTFNAQTLAILARSNDVLYSLAPIVERLSIIFVHIFSNVLLFYAVMKGRMRWMWVAFVFKSAVDAIAAFAQAWGVETTGKVWTIEALMVLFGIIAWWGIQKIGQRYRAEAQPVADAAAVPVTNS